MDPPLSLLTVEDRSRRHRSVRIGESDGMCFVVRIRYRLGTRAAATRRVRRMPLFVAVFPPDSVNDVLHSVASRRVRDVHWATENHWHITLRFFGEAPVETVVDRLRHLKASPARATLGPATSAPWGPRTLVVPVTGLDQLAAQIAAATRDIGKPRGVLLRTRRSRPLGCLSREPRRHRSRRLLRHHRADPHR